MLKKSIFTLIFLAVIGCVSAQSLRFELNGTVYSDGETVVCTNDLYGFGEYVQDMQIRNLTSGDLNVVVKKEVVENLEGTTNFFCWGMCFGPDLEVSPAVPVAANSVSAEGSLSFHVAFDESVFGYVLMKYSAYDERNPDDKVTILVKFHKSGAGLNEVPTCSFGHAYPNPASSVVRFNYVLSSTGNAVVGIYNLLGQEVMTQELDSFQGQLSFSVADLQEGIYFCTLLVNGKALQTEKFVVKK